MPGRLLLLSGPPGSGKSSVASALARTWAVGAHMRTDDFWHMIVSGLIAPYEPEADTQNHTVVEASAAASTCLAGRGIDTVVDGVIGPWMLPHFVHRAEGADVDVDLSLIVLRPRRDVALARARARSGPDDLVDEGPILQMWDQFADLGPLEHHVLDTSDESLSTTLTRVDRALTSRSHVLSERV